MRFRTKELIRAALALLLVSLLALPTGAVERSKLSPEAPRLIVVVVIDQFRADYLVRFRHRDRKSVV